jgi:hypothetical protein
LALNNHGNSLVALDLALSESGLKALALLQACTAISTLSITCLGRSPDLKTNEHDVFLEIVEWLQKCNHLVDVAMLSLTSAPDLLIPVLLNDCVTLEKLEIKGRESCLYVAKDHDTFHQALRQQRLLRELILEADPDDMDDGDNEVLLDVLCSLTNLRYLRLQRISSLFSDAHIIMLVRKLQHLQHLTTGGFNITDRIWSSITGLPDLKQFVCLGLSTFTGEGVLRYVQSLGPGNNNMVLSILNQDYDAEIAEVALDEIRNTLATNLNAKLEFVYMRGRRARGQTMGHVELIYTRRSQPFGVRLGPL